MGKRVLLGTAVLVVAAGSVSLARAVFAAREAARRSQCVCNLKQLALGLANYESSFGCYPPGTVTHQALPAERRLSWLVGAWAFCGDPQIQLTLDLTRTWDDPANHTPTGTNSFPGPDGQPVPAAEIRGSAWRCPSGNQEKTPGRPAPLQYVGVTGVGPDAATLPAKHPRAGVFGYDRTTTVADIADGTSHTMSLAEISTGVGPWTAGPAGLRAVDPARRPHVGPGRSFGGVHPGGMNAAFADGSVRFIRETVDPRVFEATATAAGGERLDDDNDRLIENEPAAPPKGDAATGR